MPNHNEIPPKDPPKGSPRDITPADPAQGNRGLPSKTTLTFSGKEKYDRDATIDFLVDCRFENYAVRETDLLRMQPAILIFINETIDEINHSAEPSQEPQEDYLTRTTVKSKFSMPFPDLNLGVDLVKYADYLLLYRIILQDAYKDQDIFCNDYLTFKQENSHMIHGLAAANPFIIKMHLLNLYNQIVTINQMLNGAIKPDPQHLANYQLYRQELEELIPIISSLPIAKYGVYRHYLAAFLHFALANCYAVRGSMKIFNLKEYEFREKRNMHLSETYIFALRGEAFSKRSQEYQEAQEDQFLNFLTLKQGLFYDMPIKSFAEFKNYIESSGLLTPKEIDLCLARYKIEQQAADRTS